MAGALISEYGQLAHLTPLSLLPAPYSLISHCRRNTRQIPSHMYEHRADNKHIITQYLLSYTLSLLRQRVRGERLAPEERLLFIHSIGNTCLTKVISPMT